MLLHSLGHSLVAESSVGVILFLESNIHAQQRVCSLTVIHACAERGMKLAFNFNEIAKSETRCQNALQVVEENKEVVPNQQKRKACVGLPEAAFSMLLKPFHYACTFDHIIYSISLILYEINVYMKGTQVVHMSKSVFLNKMNLQLIYCKICIYCPI